MLQSMKHRGPDSSGFALYGPPSDLLVMRIKLADPNEARGFGWSERLERHRNEVEHRLAKIGAMVDVMHGDQEYAYRVTFRYSGELKPLADYMEDVPGCEVLSLGHSLEIVKDLNDAESVAERYRLNGFTGTHAIGHVRMATESDVDISGAHPYWAYPFSDIAVVHNGQLTNYHMWRRRLERLGHRFQSECDSEIIAVYLAQKMDGGLSLETAMKQSLDELERRLHLPGRDVRLARRGQGRDGGQAAGPVRIPGTGRARLRGGRHPRRDRPRDRHLRPLRARSAGVAPVKISYDARGLAEPVAQAPRVATVEPGENGLVAVFDAAELTTRQINLELRRLVYDEGVAEVTIRNPGAKHSLAVGILARCRITIEGSLGYFGCGLIDGPEIHITGRVGWSVAENMMSGVVVIDKNSGSLTGAALRGGDVVVRGDVGARSGIDQKGGTIIVGGNAGMMTGFMLQRGRQVICGNVGGGLGDSMYDGTIYVGGTVASLGVDCVEAGLTPQDDEFLARKLGIYGIEAPAQLAQVRVRAEALELRQPRAGRTQACPVDRRSRRQAEGEIT